MQKGKAAVKEKKQLFSSAESILVKKDLSEIWRRNSMRALMMALPLVLAVILPIVCFAAISLLPEQTISSVPQLLRTMVGWNSDSSGSRPFWATVFTSLICPILYLMVPVICAVASASCAFVDEKEKGTLETLRLSSMSTKSIFNAKITVCVLISAAISLITFVIFTVTVFIADLLVGAPFFFNLEWLATVVFLMPVLCLFSVVFVSIILPKVHSTAESLQTMGYLILPLLLLYLIQFSGAFRITAAFLIFLAVLLLILSIVLFNFSSRKFLFEDLSSARRRS